MRGKQNWAWAITSALGTTHGRVRAASTRDALRHALHQIHPTGPLVGEAHRIPSDVLRQVLTGQDSPFKLSTADYTIHVQAVPSETALRNRQPGRPLGQLVREVGYRLPLQALPAGNRFYLGSADDEGHTWSHRDAA